MEIDDEILKLRNVGYSWRSISRELKRQGVSLSHIAVRKHFLKNTPVNNPQIKEPEVNTQPIPLIPQREEEPTMQQHDREEVNAPPPKKQEEPTPFVMTPMTKLHIGTSFIVGPFFKVDDISSK